MQVWYVCYIYLAIEYSAQLSEQYVGLVLLIIVSSANVPFVSVELVIAVSTGRVRVKNPLRYSR